MAYFAACGSEIGYCDELIGIVSALCAKFCFGCAKSLLPPSAAEYSLDRDLFFMISLREITKNKSLSKYYLARSAKKILFIQPLSKQYTTGCQEIISGHRWRGSKTHRTAGYGGCRVVPDSRQ